MMIFTRAVAAALACIVLYTLLRIHWHEERIQSLEDRLLGTDADPSDETGDDDGGVDAPVKETALKEAVVKEENCEPEANEDAVRNTDTDAPDDAIVIVTEAVVEHGESEEEEESRKEEEDEEPPVLSGFQRIQRRRAEMASDLHT